LLRCTLALPTCFSMSLGLAGSSSSSSSSAQCHVVSWHAAAIGCCGQLQAGTPGACTIAVWLHSHVHEAWTLAANRQRLVAILGGGVWWGWVATHTAHGLWRKRGEGDLHFGNYVLPTGRPCQPSTGASCVPQAATRPSRGPQICSHEALRSEQGALGSQEAP
jgi:hypothetical protein